MKRFVIGGQEVNVEISPTLVETLDESLDNMTINLEINDNPKPYKPLESPVRVYDNNTLIAEFLISSDTVELAGTNPNRYKHTLSLIQNSQRLTKNLIRNTVFSTSLEYANSINKKIGGNWRYVGPIGTFAVDNNTATYDLSDINVQLFKLHINFDVYYATSRIYADEQQVGSQQDPEWEENYYYSIRKREINKWSDFCSNYPKITFSITGDAEVKEWQLDSTLKDNQILSIPNEILTWIQQHNSGTLTVSVSLDIPTSQWGVTALNPRIHYHQVNHPIFIKLVFDCIVDFVDYSVYDVIDTLLKQYQKNTKAYNINNDGFIQPLFLLPTEQHNPDLYNLLKNTNSPNFIFTQSSIFDALDEIFRLFDATFRIDKDGYLDIEYFNEHSPTLMTNSKIAGRSSSLGEERFANRLVTFFQNTKVDDKFPNSNNENATACVRSKSLGVPGMNDFVFEVPKPINFIKRVLLSGNFVTNQAEKISDPYYIGIAYNYYTFSNQDTKRTIDITPLVVESSIWSLLPVTGSYNPFNPELSQESALSYEKGSKYIEISNYYNITNENALLNNQIAILTNVYKYATMLIYGLNSLTGWNFSASNIDWKNVRLAVDYEALTDGKLVNESIDYKYDGEILTNQDNGSIDINKLGLNMVGLSLKLGQPTLTMTQKFTNWNDRIKKGQYFIDSTDGSRWVANTCSYTLVTNDIVQATIEFVKNFNGLASRIQLNKEKRLSNISNELTVKCEENYGEYIFYSPNNLEDIEQETFSPFTDIDGEPIALDQYEIANMFAMGFGGTLEKTVIGSLDLSSSPKAVFLEWGDVATNNGDLRHVYIILDACVSGTPTNTGEIRISPNPNSLSQYFTVPKSSGKQNAIEYNPKTGEFFFNETNTFNTDEATSQIVEGTEVVVTLIMEGNEILFAAINDVTHFPTGDVYNYLHVNSCYVPNTDKIEYALITALDKDNYIIRTDERTEVRNIAIPMVVYGSGNSVCFEMSFDSPISAGKQLLNNYTSMVGTGYFSKYVLYTGLDGKAEKFTINFVKMLEELTNEFPSMTNNGYLLSTYSYGKLEEFEYHKKPNEIFALNYQLHFLPAVTTYTVGEETLRDEGGFLTNEFIKNNGFANGLNTKKLYFQGLNSDSDPFSILDVKAERVSIYRREIVNAYAQKVGDYQFAMCFELSSGFQPAIALRITHWAIVDEDDNIYFASNLSFRKATSRGDSAFSFEFMTRHHRLF